MITRIVKLEFNETDIDEFLHYFDEIKHVVNTFDGCYGMKLYQDIQHPSTVFTYSHWKSEADLDKYRNSEAFGQIWPRIKPWFCDKPEAWTVNAYFNGFDEKK